MTNEPLAPELEALLVPLRAGRAHVRVARARRRRLTQVAALALSCLAVLPGASALLPAPIDREANSQSSIQAGAPCTGPAWATRPKWLSSGNCW
jgi:hypothetical protein